MMQYFSRFLRILAVVIVAGVSTTLVQLHQPAAAQERPSVADLLDRIANKLPIGTTIAQATPAELQAAVYAAVRDALIEEPGLAAEFAASLASIAPEAAAAVQGAIEDAIADAVAANELDPEIADQVAQQVAESIEEAAPGTTATIEEVPTEALVQSGT